MNFKVKRKLTYGTIIAYQLCTGLNYAVIIPTLWDYLQNHFGGTAITFGVVIGSYSFSPLFVSIFINFWHGKMLNTRSALMLTTCFEIVGNLMYFVSTSLWILLIGRLLSGIGGSGQNAIIRDMTRSNFDEGGVSTFSYVTFFHELGFVMGPVCAVFLSKMDFHLFYFPVNKFTSPGIFMTFIWLLIEVAVLLLYHNLGNLKSEEDIENLLENCRSDSCVPESSGCGELDSTSIEIMFTSSYPPFLTKTTHLDNVTNPLLPNTSQANLCPELLSSSAQHFYIHDKEEIETIQCRNVCDAAAHNMYTDVLENRPGTKIWRLANVRAGSISDKMIESAERLIQSTSETQGNYLDASTSIPEIRNISQLSTDAADDSSPPSSHFNEKSWLLASSKQNTLREEIVILFGITFTALFTKTLIETVITPIAEKYYNFSVMDNCYVFLLVGIEVILVLTAVKCIGERISNRVLLIIGLLAMSVALIMPLLFIPASIPGERKSLTLFILMLVTAMIGAGVLMACSASLLFKLINIDSQDFIQQLHQSVYYIGSILGPLWGGSFLHYLHFLFIIPMAITMLMLVLLFCSFKKLKV